MPLYDYQCLSCGHKFELRQSFDADPTTICPQCNGSSRRKFNAVPVHYRGSGFYTTDYKRSSANSSSEDGSSKRESNAEDGSSKRESKEKQAKEKSDQEVSSKAKED